MASEVDEKEVTFTVTTGPGESPLCSICRDVLQVAHHEFRGRKGQVLKTNASLDERARQGCHLCSLFRFTLIKTGSRATCSKDQTVRKKVYKYSRPYSNLSDLQISDELRRTVVLRAYEGSACSVGTAPFTDRLQCMKLASTWFEQCNDSHESCHQQIGVFTPTRLIYVGSETPPKPNLCLGVGLAPGVRYLTLSHCWGTKRPITLTLSNLHAMLESIDFANLPKTYQDAIMIVQKLGESYLWIDSLCIIQDSSEDWQKESGCMAKVYSHGVCNLMASESADDSGGLLLERDMAATRFVTVKNSNGRLVHYYDRESKSEFTLGPLYKRAWVFQERLLSTRNLHFTQNQVFFECRQSWASELFPALNIPENLVNFGPRLLKASYLSALSSDEHTDAYDLWINFLVLYTSYSLSYTTDRLIALAGLAAQVYTVWRTPYLAGIWEGARLAEQLCWQCLRPGHKFPFDLILEEEMRCTNTSASAYIAPSWSWASSSFQIFNHRRWSYITAGSSTLFRLLQRNIELAEENNAFGQVKSDFLRLRCHLRRIRLSWRRDDNEIFRFEFPSDNSPSIWGFSMNWSDEKCVPSEVDCLYAMPVLRSELEKVARRVSGILLQPVPLISGTFKRVGMFSARTCDVSDRLLEKYRWCERDGALAGHLVEPDGDGEMAWYDITII